MRVTVQRESASLCWLPSLTWAWRSMQFYTSHGLRPIVGTIKTCEVCRQHLRLFAMLWSEWILRRVFNRGDWRRGLRWSSLCLIARDGLFKLELYFVNFFLLTPFFYGYWAFVVNCARRIVSTSCYLISRWLFCWILEALFLRGWVGRHGSRNLSLRFLAGFFSFHFSCHMCCDAVRAIWRERSSERPIPHVKCIKDADDTAPDDTTQALLMGPGWFVQSSCVHCCTHDVMQKLVKKGKCRTQFHFKV